MTLSFVILVLKFDFFLSPVAIHDLSEHNYIMYACLKGKKAWSKEIRKVGFTLLNRFCTVLF